MKARHMVWGVGILAGIGILGLLIFFIVAANPDNHEQGQTLPGGGRVILKKVSYGKKHTLHTGSRLGQKLGRWLPNRLVFPAYAEIKHDTPADSLVVFLAQQNTAGAYTNVQWESLALVDEHGCKWVRSGGRYNSLGGMSVGLQEFSVFPRRAHQFQLVFQESDTNIVFFTIHNPSIANPQVQWKTEPLPISKTNGSLVVRLNGVSISQGSHGERWTGLNLNLEQASGPAPEWSIDSQSWRDAAGNTTYDCLCPFEPAWKLQLQLYRNEKASFADREKLVVSIPAFPGPGEFKLLGQTGLIHGAALKLAALGGAGILTFSNDIPVSAKPSKERGRSLSTSSIYNQGVMVSTAQVTSDKPVFALQCTGLRDNQHLMILAKDEHQQILRSEGGYSACGNLRFISFPDFPPRHPVTLEVIVQNLLSVEFVIKPPKVPAR